MPKPTKRPIPPDVARPSIVFDAKGENADKKEMLWFCCKLSFVVGWIFGFCIAYALGVN